MSAPANTVYWVGDAQDVSQVDTITIANTWAADDTATVTINDKSITFTVVTGSTATTDVASGLQAAIEAQKSDYGEWTEVTATVDSSVVTLTWTAGKPHTVTASESTAGSGTATYASVTAATGKHFADNAANYSGGSLPSASDDVILRNGSVSVKYGLDEWEDVGDIIIYGSYTGQIGLYDVNTDDASLPYQEYRTTHVTISDGSTTIADVFLLAGGNGPSLARFDAQDYSSGGSLTVNNAISSTARYVIDIINGDGMTVEVDAGSVLVQDSATPTVNVNGGRVAVRESTGLTTTNKGGTVDISNTTITALTNDAGTTGIYGIGAITTINANDGEVFDYTESTITTLNNTSGYTIKSAGSKTIATTVWKPEGQDPA